MNLLEWIAKFFYPCAHHWEIVEKLQDRPKNPRKVTIVRGCTICGELDTVIVEAPTPPPEPAPPPPKCPPHKWKTVNVVQIVKDVTAPRDKIDTVGHRYEQECELCGEFRVKTLRGEGVV